MNNTNVPNNNNGARQRQVPPCVISVQGDTPIATVTRHNKHSNSNHTANPYYHQQSGFPTDQRFSYNTNVPNNGARKRQVPPCVISVQGGTPIATVTRQNEHSNSNHTANSYHHQQYGFPTEPKISYWHPNFLVQTPFWQPHPNHQQLNAARTTNYVQSTHSYPVVNRVFRDQIPTQVIVNVLNHKQIQKQSMNSATRPNHQHMRSMKNLLNFSNNITAPSSNNNSQQSPATGTQNMATMPHNTHSEDSDNEEVQQPLTEHLISNELIPDKTPFLIHNESTALGKN